MLNTQEKKEIAELIDMTAEIIGTQLKPTTVAVMVYDLSEYSVIDIKQALTVCRREVKGRLVLKDIIDRLPNATTLPNADEMFAQIAEWCMDESKTFILPEIAFRACEETNGGVYDALMAHDRTGARMAYKSAYERLAKAHTGEINYVVRIGTDRAHSEATILSAIKHGKLTIEYAKALLPHLNYDGVGVLSDGGFLKNLENKMY